MAAHTASALKSKMHCPLVRSWDNSASRGPIAICPGGDALISARARTPGGHVPREGRTLECPAGAP
eukprot:1627371-Pyramimonas_sp.AAC.1